MNQDADQLMIANQPHAHGGVVHSMLQFLWLLRRRRSLVIASLAISTMLGVLYYATAARIYRAGAQVVVRLSQPDSATANIGADRSTQDQMATFQKLFTSAVVLNGGIDRMTELPPEIDIQDSREKAIETLRENVVATTIRGTSIIEVSCQSRNPKAAAHVVDAIVAAYIEYIDRNHQSVKAEVSKLLKTGRREYEARLADVEQRLLIARKESADYGINGDSAVVHPLIQNVININDRLSETRQRRIELQSSLGALRETVTSGGDLRQHLVALEPLIGKDLLLDAVGINPQDAIAVQDTQRTILDKEAELRSLSAHLGEKHYRIVDLQEQINSAKQFLSGFDERMQVRMSQMQDSRLGSMLLHLLEEDLARTLRHENELTKEYNYADQRASALSDQLALVSSLERDADWLRSQLESLMGKIENIDINQRNSDVRVAMVSPPVIPDRPVSPVLTRVLVVCMFLGTALGSVVVYVADVIDDRFRSPEEIQEQLGVPVLAMARRHDVGDGHGLETLQVYRSPDAVESEAFRTLRTTLAFSGQECNCIVVTSSEPSDGKTTVLSNLGVSYALAGKRTLLVDCDLRKPGLTKLFQLRGEDGVSEILRSDEDIVAACERRLHSTELENLSVISAGRRPADSAELLSRERFADLLGWAESNFDQILIDSPPILAAADAAIASRTTDGIMLVVQPKKNHRRLVLRAYEGLVSLGANVLGTVVNAVDDEDGSSYYGYGGYGYGYGYGYGAGYGADETDEEELTEAASTSLGRPVLKLAREGAGRSEKHAA